MPDIVLTTLNARYAHAAFGLRYLLANLGDLQPRARIVEFDINQQPIDIAESLLDLQPRILGIGVYIWNVEPVRVLLTVLRRLQPGLKVVVGGPEVSHETGSSPLLPLVDHVITGEADLEFAEVCRQLLDLDPSGPGLPKILAAALPDVTRLALPYAFYTDEDCAHRVVYVEASRGCPYRCEFCLSSLDIPVRAFPLPALLDALDHLLQRGVRRFKFVDRTFNLHLPTSSRILEFFLERLAPGLFLHFEMVPDRLPTPLRDLIARFPPGCLQFEVGIQTLNPEVEARISRRQDHARLRDNLIWLRGHSGVHIHADLIAGLPGESLESFSRGFDQLLDLRPHEIQVGLLKRLRGTPIDRHSAEWDMVYNPHPPYDILSNRQLDFQTLARLRRFARFWDLYHNSGNFPTALPLLWTRTANAAGQPQDVVRSPFGAFLHFSDHLHQWGAGTRGIALSRQFQFLARHLGSILQLDEPAWLPALRADYLRPGRNDLPPFLRDGHEPGPTRRPPPSPAGDLPTRQQRHHALSLRTSPVAPPPTEG